MIISNRTLYTVKLIDEFGECYHEEDIVGFAERQKFIKGLSGDVTAIVKTSGEELWFYETEVQRGLGE